MNYKEISYADEKEWHSIRQKHIGGSDCSIIMGENPYNEDLHQSSFDDNIGYRYQQFYGQS